MVKEGLNLIDKKLLELINLIKDTIDIIISIKVDDKLQELNKSKKDIKNPSEKYEELLRQEEGEIRKHIGIGHQLKLQIEKLQEKIDFLEKKQIVSLNK